MTAKDDCGWPVGTFEGNRCCAAEYYARAHRAILDKVPDIADRINAEWSKAWERHRATLDIVDTPNTRALLYDAIDAAFCRETLDTTRDQSAVAAERERCAKIAQDLDISENGAMIADAIRDPKGGVP